jgi:quercetin dioxygenase-like cupin family protein
MLALMARHCRALNFDGRGGYSSMSGYFVDKKDCSHHRIFPGVDIFTACGEQMMLSLVEMEPLAVVEEHSHPHEQMGLMLEGEADFTIGGQTMRIVAGQMWRIPGGVPHKVVAGDRPVRALDVFHPPREDYK